MTGKLWEFVFAVWFSGVLSGFAQMILATSLAALLGHWLIHRRFILGQWWEQQNEAYSDIIDNLVAMKLMLDSWIERLNRGGWAGEEIWPEYHRARGEVECVVVAGDYVVSRKTTETLAELIELLKAVVAPGLDPQTLGASLLMESLKMYRSRVESCLEVVRGEAKSDLRVRWWSL
jgi:hypothetical protein